MSVADKGKSMLPQLEAFDSAGVDIANGHISGEYEEYLRLKEVFVGAKLQKLVRKVEYVTYSLPMETRLITMQSSCPPSARPDLSPFLHRP